MTSENLHVYYSPAYVAAAERGETIQKAQWIVESLRRRPIPGVELVAPQPVTASEIQEIHSPDYVTALETGHPRSLAESSGLQWDPGLWTSVTASNGGVVRAALEALTTKRHAGSLSSGIHHARANRGSAYCSVNGLALSARAALRHGARRVLILDVDAHCGGGTYGIVRNWPEVVHLDVAVCDFDAYEPDRSTRSTLDVVTDADAYLPTLQRRLGALDDEHFDLVVLGAGVDCHEGNSGVSGIAFRVLAEREAAIFSWAAARRVPVAFCPLGGYLASGAGLDAAALSRLHRLAIAAAACANTGQPATPHQIMELASTQDGTEGFCFDTTGRKEDFSVHGDRLMDEDDDPYGFDIMEVAKLTPENRTIFFERRFAHAGTSGDFLRELLESQAREGGEIDSGTEWPRRTR